VPDREWKFGVHLGKLRTIGEVQLPHIAYAYASANRQIADTTANDEDTFTKDLGSNGGSLHEILRLWSDLRDRLQNFSAGTATDLEEAGRTVVHIANTYAETDWESSAAMLFTYREFLEKDGTLSYGVPEVKTTNEQGS
jgi:hypothetical protein